MGLLKSVKGIDNIDYYEYREHQYFNKYDYRLRLKIPCARYTYFCKKQSDLIRKLDTDEINAYWVKKEDRDAVLKNLEALNYLIDLQTKRKILKSFTIRQEGNHVSIFSNEIDFINKITKDLSKKYVLDTSQVQVSSFTGVKTFVNKPKHNFRVYFKTKRVNDNLHDTLREILNKQKNLYPSTALKKWLYETRYNQWSYFFLSSSYFIEYDDESYLSYLAIMCSEILGRKYKLEQRQNVE